MAELLLCWKAWKHLDKHNTKMTPQEEHELANKRGPLFAAVHPTAASSKEM